MEEKDYSINFSEDVVALYAAEAVCETDGISKLVPVPGITDTIQRNIFGRQNDGVDGIKIANDGSGTLIIDVYAAVKYGVKIPQTAWNVQENVKRKIENNTKLRVRAVNIHVMDVIFS